MEFVICTADGKFTCALCLDFKPRLKKHVVDRHFEHCHFNHKVVHNGENIYLCKKGCTKDNLGHYHCICGCQKILSKKKRLIAHLNSSKESSMNVNPINAAHLNSSKESSMNVNPINAENISEKACQDDDFENDFDSERIMLKKASGEKVACSECNLVLYRKNMKEHILRKHTENVNRQYLNHMHEGRCIDKTNGVYLVSETRSGIQHPIHVQKLIRGNFPPKIFCESKKCDVDKTIMANSGEPTFECDHLKSVNLYESPPEFVLDETMLDALVHEKRINESSKKLCLLKKRECDGRGVVLVSGMVPTNSSDRWVFVSVWDGNINWYSRLGRVVVTFDKEKFSLVCRCNGSSCNHRLIAKWYLRCVYPGVLLSKEVDPFLSCSVGLRKAFSPDVEYVYKVKKIKCPMVIPSEQFSSDMVVAPSESKCPSEDCGGSLSLDECIKNVKLLTWSGFRTIKMVWSKRCVECSAMINYSDISEGIFNYNNNFFVSINLLLHLQAAIREHVAVSKNINIIEKLHRINIDHNLVRRTFYKFLALVDDEGNFNCVLCGYHPVILTFDVTRKVVFKLGKYDIGAAENELVNAKEFWDNLRKYVMSEYSDRSVKPTLDYWAPYIPEKSRKGDFVLNTEFLKGTHDSDEQEFLECLSEESLEGLLNTDVSTLRELCEECGIKASNLTRHKCIEKLTEALKNHVRIDKFFVKLWHSSGGLLTASCPHGCVYCCKFLLKPESARDMADIILSLKHPPNVIISDIPHMLASHVNKREKREFFNPYCGRVVEPTEDNIKKAEAKELSISVEWLNKRTEKALTDLRIDGSDIHPITLTTQRLSLCDKFHEGNTSQRKEFVRKTGQIIELAGVNTETAEQNNNYLKGSQYFLDCQSPVNHILVAKALLSLRNMELNSKMVGTRKTLFDVYGRLIMDTVPLSQQATAYDPIILESNDVSVFSSSFLPAVATKIPRQVDTVFPNMVECQGLASPGNYCDVPSKCKAKCSTRKVQHEQSGLPVKVQKINQNDAVPSSQQATSDESTSFSQEADLFAKESPVTAVEQLSVNYTLDHHYLYLDIKLLYSGLLNILNNCWFSAVMVAVRNSIGSSRLYEDLKVKHCDSQDAYYVDLEPVFQSLSICNAKTDLDKASLDNCLRKYFKNQIGLQQDPLPFFLFSSGMIDTIDPADNIYQINMLTNIGCVSCSAASEKTSEERCLSLSPDKDVSSDILDLIKKYFEDEKVDDKSCDRCGASMWLGKRIINVPKVLAIHLKRYDDQLSKCNEVVYPDPVLDLKDVMTAADTHYLLRAVITHKGNTLVSGHYTTTLVEEVGDRMCIEIDGTKVRFSNSEYLNTDGYIFLYESRTCKQAVVEQWFHLVFFLVSLVVCMPENKSRLASCLRAMHRALDIRDQRILHCTRVIKVIAANLGRNNSYAICHESKHKFLLKLLESRESFASFFAGTCYCFNCDKYQIHIIKYSVLKCRVTVLDILKHVTADFFVEECHYCGRLVEPVSKPIFLSKMLLFESSDLDSGLLLHDTDSMKFVNNFVVMGGVSTQCSEAVLQKEGCWYKTIPGPLLQTVDSTTLSGKKIVIVKGDWLPVLECEHITDAKVESCKINSSNQRFALEACILNIVEDDEKLKIAEKLFYNGTVEEDEEQMLFSSLFGNSLAVHFKSENDFAEASVGAISFQLVRNVHNFTVINLQNSMIVLNAEHGDSKMKVHCLGTSEKVVKKVISVCKVMCPSASRFLLVNVPVSPYAHQTMQLLKLVYCITHNEELKLEGDLHASVTTLFLGMPPFGSTLFETRLEEKCSYFYAAPLFLTGFKTTYDHADKGKLFARGEIATVTTKRVKEVYSAYEVGMMRDDILPEMLNYVMTKKRLIVDYYFMVNNENDDIRRIVSLLRNSKYKDLFSRGNFMMLHRNKMLEIFPAKLYYCVKAILDVITRDKQGPWGHVDNCISKFHTFIINDFIELFIVKLVMIKYIIENLGVSSEDIFQKAGLVGEV